MDHQSEGRVPLVVALVDDLMSASRIENVASHLGFKTKMVGKAGMLAKGAESAHPNRPGEPVFGPQATMINTLTAWQPALLIFDLTNQAIPWQEWLAILKSSPATRRVPVICFGPHVDKAALAAANDLVSESDLVVARSQFFATMPELLSDLTNVADYAAIAEDCREPLSASALRGLEAFNRAEYFDAHEYLEDAWNEEHGPARDLYRAVLQVAVAYLQIERKNYRGAVKMFLRVRQWLDPLPDVCRGIDIGRLRVDVDNAHQTLLELGPDELHGFDLSALQPVHYEREQSALEENELTSDED